MLDKFKKKLSRDKHLLELLKGSSVAFIFKIVGMGLGYIFTLMIARWYGADTMGQFTLSLTLLNIFVTVGVFGFDNALVKFIADYNSNDKPHLVKEVYQKVLYITITLGIFLSTSLYFSADFFANSVFKNDSLVVFFRISSFAVLPFILLRINATVFRGLKDIKLFSFFQNVGIYLLGILILSFASLQQYNNNITIITQCLAINTIMIVSFI